MIRAFHAIISMYGFWLPNDPRGSGSNYVAKWDLFRYGPATKTKSSRSVAAVPHNHALRLAAKRHLRFPAVQLTGVQALAVVEGFHRASENAAYCIYACAILPDHVHLVIGRHTRPIRRIVAHMKSAATLRLYAQKLWHSDGRPVWGAHGWNVFLDSPEAVWRSIRYVERNPSKEGKRPQRWGFVQKFHH